MLATCKPVGLGNKQLPSAVTGKQTSRAGVCWSRVWLWSGVGHPAFIDQVWQMTLVVVTRDGVVGVFKDLSNEDAFALSQNQASADVSAEVKPWESEFPKA